MITFPIDFNILIYILHNKGYLRAYNVLDTLTIPANYSIMINIPVSAKCYAIPYELRLIPDKDDAIDVRLYVDGNLILHDENVKLVTWSRGFNLINDFRIILFVRERMTAIFTNKTSEDVNLILLFTWGEIREDIKAKIIDKYFDAINKELLGEKNENKKM